MWVSWVYSKLSGTWSFERSSMFTTCWGRCKAQCHGGTEAAAKHSKYQMHSDNYLLVPWMLMLHHQRQLYHHLNLLQTGSPPDLWEGIVKQRLKPALGLVENMNLWWQCCWWKKSCTSWLVYPTIYKVLYIPAGAGFLPSKVSSKRDLFDRLAFSFALHRELWFCHLFNSIVHTDCQGFMD